MAVKQLLGGRYQFIKVLGSSVDDGTYLVGDTYLQGHPKCVIKRLPLLGKGPRALQFILLLLRKKAEALKHVGTHEQVPKILAYFEENNNFYLVEEFIPGRPLSELLRPGNPWPEALVIQLLKEVLKILMVVHSWGVIHRCIKPSNIIQRQSDRKLVLTGFGIFREISAQGRASADPDEQIRVSPEHAYMALEQLQGERHFNSDIYAIGMIGIQALTGLKTVELANLRNSRSQNGTAASLQFPWHPKAVASPELKAVLDRMIHENMEMRYQTAAEVLEDVRKLDTETPNSIDSSSPSSSPPPPSPPKPPSLPRSLRQSSRKAAQPVRPPQFTPMESGPPSSQSSSQGQSSQKSGSWIWWGIGAATVLGLVVWMLMSRMPQRAIAYYHRHQGQEALNNGKTDQAIEHFSTALQHHQSGDIYLQRGLVHQQKENWRMAQDDFSQAIQRDPTLEQAFYKRGNIRFQLGDRQGALEDYTKAITINPRAVKAYMNRGSVRGELGDEFGAIDDYSAAIQQDPSFAPAYLNRCLSRSNIDDHQGAIADCTQAIGLMPNSVMAYQNRGLARRRLGDSLGALEDFNIAINLDPDDPDPYFNRGLARLELGDQMGAIDDYTEAINRKPDHALAYYERGLARAEANDMLGAIADFRTSGKLCLDAGRQGCYEDAQYHITQIQEQDTSASPDIVPSFDLLE